MSKTVYEVDAFRDAFKQLRLGWAQLWWRR
jgi:hypothetical protein